MAASTRSNDRHRTRNVSSEMLQQLATADVKGWPLNGSGKREHPSQEEQDEIRDQQLAESIELRSFLVDLFGEESFNELLHLYLFLSLREFSVEILGLPKPDPTKPRRRMVRERPLLRQMILIGTFHCERLIGSKLQRYLDMCRRKDMSEIALSEHLPSDWVVISPRTARAVSHFDAWSVPIVGQQAQYESLSDNAVSDYIRDHASVLFAEHDAYLSLHQQRGLITLEVIRVFSDVDSARSFARRIEQRWITNLKTGTIVDAMDAS